MNVAWQDADNLVLNSVQADDAADHGRISRETAPPRGVADNHDAVPPYGFLVLGERASQLRPDAKHREEAGGSPRGQQASWLSTPREIDSATEQQPGPRLP